MKCCSKRVVAIQFSRCSLEQQSWSYVADQTRLVVVESNDAEVVSSIRQPREVGKGLSVQCWLGDSAFPFDEVAVRHTAGGVAVLQEVVLSKRPLCGSAVLSEEEDLVDLLCLPTTPRRHQEKTEAG